MKMMIVVLNDQDGDPVIKALVDDEFRVTRIASTGGFLRRGNSTLLIGRKSGSIRLWKLSGLIRKNPINLA